jgi:hypothetical protein
MLRVVGLALVVLLQHAAGSSQSNLFVQFLNFVFAASRAAGDAALIGGNRFFAGNSTCHLSLQGTFCDA